MEQVCLKSFVAHGHDTVLYSYEPIDNAPDGVTVEDARIIIPDFKLFDHFNSIAAFADRFRVEMIAQTGRIWVDADVACLKPFPNDDYVFAKSGRYYLNGIVGFPSQSKTLQMLREFLNNPMLELDDEWKTRTYFKRREIEYLPAKEGHFTISDEEKAKLPYIFFGPLALNHFLLKTGEGRHALPEHLFYAQPAIDIKVNYNRPWRIGINPPEDAFALHGVGGTPFRKMWNRRGVFNEPHPNSFVGKLCKEHDIDPMAAPYVPK